MAETWRLRVKKRLKDDKINYRDLARNMEIGYTTLQNHLDEKSNKDSLKFIRSLCRIRKYSMQWVLFGIDEEEKYIKTSPWLTRHGVNQWIKSKTGTESKHIISWFNLPAILNIASDRTFVWQVKSDEVSDCGWPVNSWLYIDPDRQLIKRESTGLSKYQTTGSPLCLVKLKESDGLMICRLETVANRIWVLPGNTMYPVHTLDDVELIGQVIAGLRNQGEIL